MFTNRLIKLFIFLALALVIALTVREALATAEVISQARSTKQSAVECTSLPSRYSIHTRSVGVMSVLYTEDGPTGVDGGLVELLSNYRTCSQ